jgi:hypothetical protein
MLDYKLNNYIFRELRIKQTTRFMKNYQTDSKQHVKRMFYNRIPKHIIDQA